MKTSIRKLLLLLLLIAAAPLRAQQLPALIPYAADSLWGYSDRQGHVRIAPQWPEVAFFRDGSARVQLQAGSYWYGLINTVGGYIIPPSPRWTGELTDWKVTYLNIVDDQGRWGLVDDKGRVRIPPRFDHTDQSFAYCPAWERLALVVELDGKKGIIDTAGKVLVPFEYEQLLPVFEWPETDSRAEGKVCPALRRLIVAVKGGKTGVIDRDNRIVVPFGLYDQLSFEKPCWIRYGSSTGSSGMLDSQGSVVIPAGVHREIRPAGTDYFVVTNSVARTDPQALGPTCQMALIDRRGRIVFPYRFWSLYAYAGSLMVTLQDSALPPDYPNQEGSALRWYYQRSYTLPGLQPLKEWSLRVWTLPQEPSCGMSSRNHVFGESPRINGLVQHFDKDSIRWSSVAIISPGLYLIRGYGQTEGDRRRPGRGELTAVVNDSLRFVLGPLPHAPDVFSINPGDRLFVVRKSSYEQSRGRDQYALLDFRQRVLIPFGERQIVNAFRWKQRLYTTVPDRVQYSRGYSDFSGYRLRLADAAAVPVPAMAHYILLQNLPAGPSSKQPEGSFLAADTAGRQGLVTIEGAVLPAISFKAALLIPLGDGLYLSGNSKGSYALINEKGKELVAGLRVSGAQPATAYRLYGDPRDTYGRTLPKLYEMHTDGSSGWPRRFYVNANGIVFARQRSK